VGREVCRELALMGAQVYTGEAAATRQHRRHTQLRAEMAEFCEPHNRMHAVWVHHLQGNPVVMA
jgi:hypothetical protein